MPNDVETTLTITGPEEDVRQLIEQVKGIDQEGAQSAFDLNKIDPMPPEYGHTGLLRHPNREKLVLSRESAVKITELGEVAGSAVQDGQIILLDKEALKERYGHAGWYSWRIAHWGTKWNAFGTSLVYNNGNEAQFFFVTAWNEPKIALEKLAAAFPRCTLHVHVGGEIEGEPFEYSLKGEELPPERQGFCRQDGVAEYLADSYPLRHVRPFRTKPTKTLSGGASRLKPHEVPDQQ